MNITFEVKQILNLAAYGRGELQPTGGKKLRNLQEVYQETHRWFNKKLTGGLIRNSQVV